MDFVFQDFQSSMPLWVYLLLFAATTTLSWWSYRGLTSGGTLYRYGLISLRSLTFFILLILLINPVFRAETNYYEKPELLVLLDNSESLTIQKGDYEGVETYRNVLNTLELTDSSSADYTYLGIGSDTRPLPIDELSHDADRTNLNSAVSAILQQQSEATAAIMLTDGIYNSGQNPVFDARKVEIPVFTVALGDTAAQRDLLVNSVSTNETGYVDTEQPVSVTVSARGFRNQSFNVNIRKDNEIIDSQTVTPEIDNYTMTVSFDLSLDEEGLQQYQVVIPEETGEWTASNNSQYFSIDVQDAKQRILSLAFEVHPDVRFIRSLLLRDENSSLTPRTWVKGNRFIEGNLAVNPDTVDLVIFHGFPEAGIPQDIENTLISLLENTPAVITALPLFSGRSLQTVTSTPLPVDIASQLRYESIQLTNRAERADHPIMELPAINFDQLPPLFGPIRNLKLVPGARMLFGSNYQGQSTGVPLLSIIEAGNKRNAFVSGYGWYRLAQNTSNSVRDFTEQLWFNVISWTAADPDNRRLSVKPSKRSYSGSEGIILNGYLENESGEAEPEARIDIELSSDTMEARFYSMDNQGAGQYRLNLGTMPEGIYNFEATARKGNRTLGQQSGEFAVARSNAEFVNTMRNDNLLRQISEQTGGQLFIHDSLDDFWDILDERGVLEQQEKTETTLFYPHQHWGWFVLVVLLLSTEWLLRKYISLP